MKISGFQKLTLLDFPNKIASIIFTQGCNFNCSYCQNSDLIPLKDGYFKEEEILEYLKKRRNVLDGLVISGGEPTIQKDLIPFIKKVKELGLLVKLDTNGSNPKALEELINNNLVDYVAMDIKNTFTNYHEVIKTNPNIENIKKSIELLKQSNILHEYRTTIVKNFHDINKILNICEYLGEKEIIYLQNFEDSECVLDKSLISFTREELMNIQKIINDKFPNVSIRGL